MKNIDFLIFLGNISNPGEVWWTHNFLFRPEWAPGRFSRARDLEE